VNGGTPIQLTNDTIGKLPGTWSPDGAWFVYPRIEDGRLSLMKVKTTGQASAILLKPDRNYGGVPSWSPTGEWILYGTELISPDGKVTREIGDHHSPHYVFSHDGKLLYGMRQEGERQLLFSIDLATGRERITGEVHPAMPPASNVEPSIRFTLSPDGKSFIYGSGKFKSNLWMLAGFKPRRTSLFELGLCETC
jgi:Tol biopolymer transport system component